MTSVEEGEDSRVTDIKQVSWASFVCKEREARDKWFPSSITNDKSWASKPGYAKQQRKRPTTPKSAFALAAPVLFPDISRAPKREGQVSLLHVWIPSGRNYTSITEIPMKQPTSSMESDVVITWT
ncbi:hypothetical protein MUK42_26343 [Musa troglodytarum]|uniref:Uncharacterized protein n=1 Tax=Musa troglodytarum TaxID=320322 RepID=A0A9E7FRT4_9LILI|nr:hypothetical protein MUK42_26343 [Musa troglodytarum]